MQAGRIHALSRPAGFQKQVLSSFNRIQAVKQFKDAVVFGIILSLVMHSSTAQEILLRSSNSTSKRSAFFEDDGRVAYLYLTAPGTGQLDKDVIVYMRVPPIDRAAFDALRSPARTPS